MTDQIAQVHLLAARFMSFLELSENIEDKRTLLKKGKAKIEQEVSYYITSLGDNVIRHFLGYQTSLGHRK